MNNRINAADSSPMSTLILDVDDLAAVISTVGVDRFMDEMIDVLRSSLSSFDPGNVEHHIRAGFSYEQPQHGLIEWMPSMVLDDVVAVKTVGYHPSNPSRRGLPSVLATTALYDPTTGRLVAMCEATLLTAIRTGAASAVMTEAVTTPGHIALGVVGCGAQAVTQIHAISRVREIDRLIVTDIDPTIAESLIDRLPAGVPAPTVLDLPSFNAVMADLDVVCTCTSNPVGADAVADFGRARSDLHVNAVGADFPGKTELPLDFLRSAVVVPDEIAQCLLEGESQRLTRDELGPSMVEVLSGSDSGLRSVRTVFDSTGWSFEDLLAARLFFEHAARNGLGTNVRLQVEPNDPYAPYETLGPRPVLQSIQSLASVRETG